MTDPELPMQPERLPDGPAPADPELLSRIYAEGGKRRGRVRKRHTVGKVILATMVVLALVSGLGSAYLYRYLNHNIHQVSIAGQLSPVKPVPKNVAEEDNKPLNILILGSDSRDCSGCNIDNLTGDGGRSDTTILVHLSADGKRAYGISIPRDSMIDRPSCKLKDGTVIPAETYQRWNAAYSVGGDACTVNQFQQLTGITVDDYIDVNFESFQSMVDAVGGVQVCIPQTIDDRENGIYLPAGTRTITGKEALSYVRVRHGIGDGSDLSRIKRQQAFLASLSSAVLSAHTLANPIKVIKFLDAATKGLTTDANLKKLATIGYDFRDIGLGKIKFLTIPVAADPQNPEATVVWTSEAPIIWNRINHDRPLTKAMLSGAIKAGAPGATTKKKHHKAPSATASAAATYAGLCT